MMEPMSTIMKSTMSSTSRVTRLSTEHGSLRLFQPPPLHPSEDLQDLDYEPGRQHSCSGDYACPTKKKNRETSDVPETCGPKIKSCNTASHPKYYSFVSVQRQSPYRSFELSGQARGCKCYLFRGHRDKLPAQLRALAGSTFGKSIAFVSDLAGRGSRSMFVRTTNGPGQSRTGWGVGGELIAGELGGGVTITAGSVGPLGRGARGMQIGAQEPS
ncbi:hypothetical protein B0H66DRAFT_71318 [Apodospora peruviana]|uniref:Uncharacterized protein n=1 Tax=Apodospora peruviana TaxID=516989 RepID=A0AAE0MGB1_9PEZI|nr:hypothetical protein B0H66DRAFT_71318 [Apodospora peruviana]